MGRCQQQRQPAAQVAAEERGPLRADGGEHAADLIHPILEGVAGRATVGHPVPQPVQQDQPGERGKLAEEPGHQRVLPQQRQMGRPAQQKDQVQLARTKHLIGEVGAVAAAGVGNRRAKSHEHESRIAIPDHSTNATPAAVRPWAISMRQRTAGPMLGGPCVDDLAHPAT